MSVLSHSIVYGSLQPHGLVLQAPLSMEILEWVAISSSRGSSQPWDGPRSPALQADSLPAELPGKQSQSHGGDVDSSGKLQFNSTVT